MKKRKEVNVHFLSDEFNRFRMRNLGKRFVTKDLVLELERMGFIYPNIIFMRLVHSGYIQKYKVQGRVLNTFTRLELNATSLNQLIEFARSYQKAASGSKVQVSEPSRYISLDECIQGIRIAFENEQLCRFGVLKDNFNVKDVLSALCLKGQKVVTSYKDF